MDADCSHWVSSSPVGLWYIYSIHKDPCRGLQLTRRDTSVFLSEMTGKSLVSPSAEALEAPAVDVPLQDKENPTSSREGSNQTVSSQVELLDESEEPPTRLFGWKPRSLTSDPKDEVERSEVDKW